MSKQMSLIEFCDEVRKLGFGSTCTAGVLYRMRPDGACTLDWEAYVIPKPGECVYVCASTPEAAVLDLRKRLADEARRIFGAS